MSSAFWLKVGALSGASAVGFGAFGAHGLRHSIPDVKLLETWSTAAHYQLIHSLAVCLASTVIVRPTNWSARLFSTGIALFSGSVYALVLSGNKKLGVITPIGGLALMAGWVTLAFRV